MRNYGSVATDRRVRIGVVGVDSGQLVICDPMYVARPSGDQRELNDYELLVRKFAEKRDGDAKKFLQLRYDLGHNGLGVVFDSGIGDGEYEVRATIGDLPPWGERISRCGSGSTSPVLLVSLFAPRPTAEKSS